MNPSHDTPLFSARASDFSVRNSRFLAELSLAAYETNESKLAANLKNLDVTDCRLVETIETDTQALVASTRQAIVVAFRGTATGCCGTSSGCKSSTGRFGP